MHPPRTFHFGAGIPQAYLFSGLSRQIEHKDAEKGDEDGGQNQVHRVKQSLATNCDVKCDVCLRRHGFVVHVEVGWHLDDVPRAGLPVVRQVYVVLVVV